MTEGVSLNGEIIYNFLLQNHIFFN